MTSIAAIAPAHVTQHWEVRKKAARGRGVVVSQAREAAEVGVAVLEAGGTAADAAVATAFALATVEPWNSGIGGIGFGVVHKAGEARSETLDFGPIAPAGLRPELFKLTGRMKQDLFAWPEVEGDKNIHGPMSFVIPSSVAGYAALHARHGRMPLKELIAPAVALARRGLAQDWFTTLKIANSAQVLKLYAESARIYLPGGMPPVAPYQGNPGFLQQGRLAATLERLHDAGWEDFYSGEIAAALVRDVQGMGGVISAADLAGCKPVWRPALEVGWRGRKLQLANGLTAGPTMAEVVRAMQAVPLPKGQPDTAWYAALSRAMRRAYDQRLTSLGAGTAPEPAETCTTHLTVMDKDGNAVALTTTLLSSMGSRVVLPETGVLMNNGVMWFDPTPGTPNAMAPGKRALCNMNPAILLDESGTMPFLAGGASGGRRILASVYQLLAFCADFGMSPEDAAHHPRIDVSGPEGVTADDRLDADTLAALGAETPLTVVEHAVMPVNFACPNVIQRGTDGMATGISDAMSPWSAARAMA